MQPCLVKVATVNENQWALDFAGNVRRVIKSVQLAAAAGATLRLGPELELCGYGCEDHFLESDTVAHAWEALAAVLESGVTAGILCDFGLPALHRSCRYNCRVLCADGQVLLVRPKTLLADDGNYRESRWFTPWTSPALEDFVLPSCVQAVTGQVSVPIGLAALQSLDGVTVASETCEELFTPAAPNIFLGLDGIDIITNGSGSHHQLRKLHTRVDLMRGATARGGGAYLYANQQGCDGGRLYYDGCASVYVNGELLAQGSQFSVRDVEVVAAVLDMDVIRSYRAAVVSRGVQAARLRAGATAAPPLVVVHRGTHERSAVVVTGPGWAFTSAGSAAVSAPGSSGGGFPTTMPRVMLPMALGRGAASGLVPTPPRLPLYLTPEQEIALGPACWLWDYLRRSGARGYFLPLSGGADSAATAALVGIMCQLVYTAGFIDGDADVAAEVRRVLGVGADFVPPSAAFLAARILHTCYMGTVNSSKETRERAAALAGQIGAFHIGTSIDALVSAALLVFSGIVAAIAAAASTGSSSGAAAAGAPALASRATPRYLVRGGTDNEDKALQNLQARLRMVLAYLLAQLLPWVRGQSGFLLVLGSSNVDEALRGYMTKYDCSSADLNPIGGVAKGDLGRFLGYAGREYSWPALGEIVAAPPTAELQPLAEDDGTSSGGGGVVAQTDEADMGMSYAELAWFGTLRKVHRCGPVSMYYKLVHAWGEGGRAGGAAYGLPPPHAKPLSPAEVAVKVKRFFRFYAINRHKATTLTPSYHAEAYSPEDNRFDLRPFLYPVDFTVQFAVIDADVAARAAAAATGSGSGEVSVAQAAGSE